MDKPDLVRLMLRAAASPHGLLLQVSDFNRARRAFLSAKRDEIDVPKLEFLNVQQDGGNMIIRRGEEED